MERTAREAVLFFVGVADRRLESGEMQCGLSAMLMSPDGKTALVEMYEPLFAFDSSGKLKSTRRPLSSC